MTVPLIRSLGLAALLTVLSIPAASADRDPTDRERAAVEAFLRTHGFRSWEKIAVDDDGLIWEADVLRARQADGDAQDVEVESDTTEPPTLDSLRQAASSS